MESKETPLELQTVPLVLHESAMAREHRIMRWLVVGWAVTALVLGAIIFCYANAEHEVTTETATETTTDESVSQDSGDGGYNVYSSGDVNGYPNGQ